MSVKTEKKPIWDSSTQRYLPFSQIRDNIIIMKDNSARVVLRCSTINFLLKSTPEQDAIIMSFQRFLNSIDFPIQILIRSTKLDIDWYLTKLNDLAIKQTNPLNLWIYRISKKTYRSSSNYEKRILYSCSYWWNSRFFS